MNKKGKTYNIENDSKFQTQLKEWGKRAKTLYILSLTTDGFTISYEGYMQDLEHFLYQMFHIQYEETTGKKLYCESIVDDVNEWLMNRQEGKCSLKLSGE